MSALTRRLLHTTTLGAAIGAAGLVGGALPGAAQATSITLINPAEPTLGGTQPAAPQRPRPGAPANPAVTINLTGVGESAVGAPVHLPSISDVHLPAAAPAKPAAAPIVQAQHAQAQTGPGQQNAQPAAPKSPAAPSSSSRSGKPPAPKPAVPARLGAPAAAAAPLPAAAAAAAVPALALSLLAPAPIGVPDFFIDSFQIPPFLVPIYQAAGAEYAVPWQVLAAINEIETDYGRNLVVSSAGAVGWMQFLPQTWAQYGVDANGDGVMDPYNPLDAIFATARFLHAAGASQNLAGAVSAFNNASWFVGSVMLRAKLIGGLPDQLVSSITGITNGVFPVAVAASRYADNAALPAAATTGHAAGARSPTQLIAASANIYARAGAAVLAVHDGVVIGLGRSAALGNFIRLRDAAGDTYTYSQLKKLAVHYAALLPSARKTAPIASEASHPPDHAPLVPASAGHQSVGGAPPTPPPAVPAGPSLTATDTPAGPPRLFAHPARPAAFAAGGRAQLARSHAADSTRQCPLTYGLPACDVDFKVLTTGSHVIAGTVLGRIGVVSPYEAPHLTFQVLPAGKGVHAIDPRPILDGWMLLRSTAIHPAVAVDPLAAAPPKSPSVGQLLLESDAQLEQRVLDDPTIDIQPCGRSQIQAGLIDRRVLAALALLSEAGFKPSVAALGCPIAPTPAGAGAAAAAAASPVDPPSPDSVDISAINGVPILDHQGAGSIADQAIQQLLALQGIYKPRQIVSLMTYPTTDNTFADYNHADHIHISYAGPGAPVAALGAPADEVLGPHQWLRLATRLGQIANPSVPAEPSSSAIIVPPGG